MKYAIILYLFLFALPMANAQQELSTEEIVNTLRENQRISFTLLPTLHVYKDLCLPRSQLASNMQGVCEAVLASPVCSDVEEDRRLNCQTAGDHSFSSFALDFWHFAKGCSGGVLNSVKEFLGFIWDRMKWLWRNSTSSRARSETYDQASEYIDSINLYLHTEYDKAYSDVSPPLRKTKALARMGMSISKQLLDTVMELMSQQYQELGCLNFEAKSQVVCEFFSDLFVPPISGFALLKFGIKAARRFPNLKRAFDKIGSASRSSRSRNNARIREAQNFLERPLTPRERTAIIEAHEVGKGELGVDGTPARIDNYTKAQLRQKSRILRENGFNRAEIRLLIRNGIVGLSEVESTSFQSIVADMFGRRPTHLLGRPIKSRERDAIIEAHGIGKREVGEDGTPARMGNYTQAQLRRKAQILKESGLSQADIQSLMERWNLDLSEVESIKLLEIVGDLFTQSSSSANANDLLNLPVGVPVSDARLRSSLAKPKQPVVPILGNQVAVPHGEGGLINGEISNILPDGRLQVVFKDVNGNVLEREVNSDQLLKPLSTGLHHIQVGSEVSAPKINGDISKGRIKSIKGDQALVTWQENNNSTTERWVPLQSLNKPPTGRGFAVARERELMPSQSIRVTGADDVKIGKFFQDEKGRILTIAQVTVDGKSTHRVFYRSLSQSVFRVLPAINGRHYDKGIGENALTLPPEVQAALSERARSLNRSSLDTLDPRELDGIIPVDNYKNYLRSNDHVSHAIEQNTILKRKIKRDIPDNDGRYFANPRNIRIEHEGNRPNYERHTSSYRLTSSVYGEVTAYVYPSNNGRLEYTLLKDENNKVWFGDVGNRQTSLSPHGLRSDAIDPGRELTMPLWEYEQQIPQGYNVDREKRGRYSSAWNYIREMPEIQRWYHENNMQIPPLN